MTATVKSINNAIKKYDNGARPFTFTEARSWFIAGSNNTIYPLKYIYAIAINQKPSSFNTSEPIGVLSKLDIELIHIPIESSERVYSEVKKSLRNSKSRSNRLKIAQKKPRQKNSKVVIYERNPDVIAEVLSRAEGKCENCNTKAPFKRKKDKTPYLEVHHKKPLAKGGDDTVKNAEALCPNCHRKKHYG